MSNLVLVKELEQTSSASTWSITDMFTTDYSIYRIDISGVKLASSTADLDMRLVTTGGSVISSSDYHYGIYDLLPNAGPNQYRQAGNTHFDNFLPVVGVNEFVATAELYVFNPFESSYTYCLVKGNGTQSGTVMRHRRGGGVLKTNDSIGGIQILTSNSNSINGGYVKSYGLKV